MRRERRRWIILVGILIVSNLVITGCASVFKKDEFQRKFFEGTIVYNLERDAKDNMSKLEKLQAQIEKPAEPGKPLSDPTILPIYREADANRDHQITKKEAKSYYTEFISKFEDSLGPVKIPEKK